MTIEYLPKAQKQLSKLDKTIQKHIKKYMDEVSTLSDVRSRGKGLTSTLSGLWRYRVLDYRVLCKICDEKVVILVVEIGHRKEIYD
ncbi:MAG TPA: type II toxin-antitoxin system RelE/ParE family toxin [Treponemataceae bacterium]|nr:type II toxin-antitoxin system RelE/ParE family toxin [Treponemataceae bacterium]